MTYHASSIVERWPLWPRAMATEPTETLTGPLTIVCPCCGDTMRHCRTILKFGMRRERLIFVCPSCNEVGNKELKRVA